VFNGKLRLAVALLDEVRLLTQASARVNLPHASYTNQR
jgi:hypothetical protein